MRTDPPFNIDNPFPDPREIKPIKGMEKSAAISREKQKEEGKKKKREEEKEENNPPPDPFGKIGGNLDISA